MHASNFAVGEVAGSVVAIAPSFRIDAKHRTSGAQLRTIVHRCAMPRNDRSVTVALIKPGHDEEG
jgi:hypothetical protein